MSTLRETQTWAETASSDDFDELLARYTRARKEAETLAGRELDAELKKRNNALWRVVVRHKVPRHSKG